jgi:hypothetical protein
MKKSNLMKIKSFTEYAELFDPFSGTSSEKVRNDRANPIDVTQDAIGKAVLVSS